MGLKWVGVLLQKLADVVVTAAFKYGARYCFEGKPGLDQVII